MKLESLGLQTAYNSDQQFHRYCRQLLALPCLPAHTVDATLQELESEATTAAQTQLCQYIYEQNGSIPTRGRLRRGRCSNAA